MTCCRGWRNSEQGPAINSRGLLAIEHAHSFFWGSVRLVTPWDRRAFRRLTKARPFFRRVLAVVKAMRARRDLSAAGSFAQARIPFTTFAGFTPVSFWSSPWKG